MRRKMDKEALGGWLFWGMAVLCIALAVTLAARYTLLHPTGPRLEDDKLHRLDITDGEVTITLRDPAQIEAFCTLWNDVWLIQVQPHGRERDQLALPFSSVEPLRVCVDSPKTLPRHFTVSALYICEYDESYETLEAAYTTGLYDLSAAIREWLTEVRE